MQAIELWSMKNVVHGTQEYHCKIISLEAEAIARDKLSAQADDKDRTPCSLETRGPWMGRAPTCSINSSRLPNLFQFSSSTHQARLDVFSKQSECVSLDVCVCLCLCERLLCNGGRWIITHRYV